MKAIIKNKEQKEEKPFPKLMIYERGEEGDLIVLFTEPKKGVFLFGDACAVEQGHYSVDWLMNPFKDFEGTIELSND